jgi:hypothetical protein
VAAQPVTKPITGEGDLTLWMLAQLEPQTQDAVRRRLALRVDKPPTALESRRRELGFVSELVRDTTPPRGWQFSYVLG